MATVSKKDICKAVCEKLGRNAFEVEQIVQAFMDQITDSLAQGNRLEFRDFGVFELRRRKARVARNPKTGSVVNVPERTAAVFKPGRIMKERVKDVVPVK